MGSYIINTDKNNIFYRTRAEAIMRHLGTHKRKVCGYLDNVLPSISTMRDLDHVDIQNKEVLVEIIMDSLQPEAFLQQRLTEQAFYIGTLRNLFNVKFRDYLEGDNTTFVVMHPTENVFSGELGEQQVLEKLNGLFSQYRDAAKIFVHSNAIVDFESKVPRYLRSYADEYCYAPGHNAFFNSALEAMIDQFGTKELVFVGGDLADQVFYTAMNAVDLDSKPSVKIMKRYVASSADNSTMKSVRSILREHFTNTLSMQPINDPYLAMQERGKGISIQLAREENKDGNRR